MLWCHTVADGLGRVIAYQLAWRRQRIVLPELGKPTTMADVTLDATGLKCPLPVLKAGKAIRQVPPGGTLEVRATDPGSVEDFMAFCDGPELELVSHNRDGDVFCFLIRKAG
jgi:tRNA 2-thiouridine synthesizing protein A